MFVQETGNTQVSESNDSDTISLVLAAAPTSDVTIQIETDDQLVSAPSSVTFTPSNWSTAQTVTLQANDNLVADGNRKSTVTFSVSSADVFYDQLPVPAVGVRVIDDDFNRDGVVDSEDIDSLFAELGSQRNRFDLDDDASLGQGDVDFLVRNLLGTNYGDSNLDGQVDFQDFLKLSANFGRKAKWAGGDFNGDGEVSFEDFLLMSQNFGMRPELSD